MKGLGERWLCPDCGAVRDKPATVVRPDDPLVTTSLFTPGSYHSWKCKHPMVRCIVELA